MVGEEGSAPVSAVAMLVVALSIMAPLFVLLLVPYDALLRRLARGKPPRMWHIETIVVAGATAAVILLTGRPWMEWLAFAAGMFGHGRSSISRRNHEAQQAAGPSASTVECWRSGRRYFYAWAVFQGAYLIVLGLWGALCQVGFAIAYDQWRELYVRRRAAGRAATFDRVTSFGAPLRAHLRASGITVPDRDHRRAAATPRTVSEIHAEIYGPLNLKHGPNERGGRGRCEPDCRKCALEAELADAHAAAREETDPR